MARPTFIICSDPDSPETQARLLEVFGEENVFVVREHSQWLVDADMMTKAVYDKIKLDIEHNPNIVVFSINTYHGLHRSDLWEWLALD